MDNSKYIVQVYTAFVTSSHVYIKGRVLKNRSPVSFIGQGPMSSLFNTILRAYSNELPFVPLKCRFGDHVFEEKTDKEGYFEIFYSISDFTSIPKEIHIEAEYKENPIYAKKAIRLYLYDVPHGIVSDIDDTILVSKVKSFFKLKMLFNTAFVNPFRRKPIESAAEAFHTLLTSSEGHSPMIYLSNSPWNIYDYLQSFLVHNAFPVGELILRDMGVQLLKTRDIHEFNKYKELEKLLTAFGNTRFTLIGDTGELDFDIYKAIYEKYPDRIERIILNNAGNPSKISEAEAYRESSALQIDIVNGYVELI